MVYCLVLSTVFLCHYIFVDNPEEIAIQLQTFGVRLKRARVARNMTLAVLAEKADLNIRTLQYIEVGQTNILITTAIRLQRGLGCPWEELLPTSPPMPPASAPRKK